MLSRNGKKILSFVMAMVFTLNLCGCGKKKDKKELYEDFLRAVNAINPEYNHPELMLSSEDIDKILEVASSTKECRSTDTDYSKLADTIIENSIAYSSEDNLIFVNYNTNYSSEYIDRDIVMRLALKKALTNIFENNYDIEEDICRLKNLVILKGNLNTGDETSVSELSFAAYVGDDTIIVDYEALEKGYHELKNNELSFMDYVALNLEHELNHARAVICDCRKNAGQEYETFNYNQTLMSITEANAESQLYGNDLDMLQKNRNLFVYQAERCQEALTLLLAAFKENRNIDDYYNALNSSNLEELYKFFGLKDTNDYEMFYYVTSTMDAIMERNGAGYFLNSQGYNTCNKREAVLGYTYKLNIFKTSLSDIVNYQNSHGDLSLEEIMFLYNLIKVYITSGTVEKVGTKQVYMVYDEEFLSYFMEIESAFYEYIATYFGVNSEKINQASSKSASYTDALLSPGSKLTANLENKFPLIKFIYATIPINIEGLDEYSEDANMILARNKD